MTDEGEKWFIRGIAVAAACLLFGSLLIGFALIAGRPAHGEEWRAYRFTPNSPAYQKRLEWQRRMEWGNHRYWQGDHWERGFPPGWDDDKEF